MVAQAADAAIQVGTTLHALPPEPRRFLLDHGAFADAPFWSFAARALNAGDTIAITSQVCRDMAARMWAGGGPELVDLPLFADASVFHPAADRRRERQLLAAELELDPGAPWILCVGSHTARKNTHLALSFFAALRASIPSARLLLVLPDPDAPSRRGTAAFLERRIAALGLNAGIRRLPALPSVELARVMRAADLLVHLTTCRIENFGLVVAESMAAGLPVLAADWGGLRDLVAPGATGLRAPTHLTARGPRVRWRGAVEAAVALLQDEPRRLAAGAAAAERATERFSLAAFRSGLVSAVDQAATRPADGGAPSMTDAAEDLRFVTIWLQAKHPEVRDTSTFFRRLLDFEGGRLASLLLGPAATSVEPPAPAAGMWAYPAVEYEVEPSRTIRVVEPAWNEALDVDPEAVGLARRALGGAASDRGLALGAGEVEAARTLVRLGVLNAERL